MSTLDDDPLDALNAKLSEFDGGTGGIVRFGDGLRTLVLQLDKDERLLTVYCVECIYIAGPVFWAASHLRCRPIGEDIRVADDDAGVEVVCHLLDCEEFVDDDESLGRE